ncbi:MAG: hypothetical protein O2968_04930 [Acidobacteria bacterium]|nr:hypothetical protein [Acidobacteriota bacterium]
MLLTSVRTQFVVWLAALIVVAAACAGCSGQAASQEALENELEQTLSGAVLEGSFTIDGRDPDPLRTERYEIQSVTKLAAGIWTFNARIQYGDHDVTLPIPVRVEWAGDTPVVSLTDATIPGLGTFSARVLFYRGQYAGTWSHGETVGNQFGRITKKPPGS